MSVSEADINISFPSSNAPGSGKVKKCANFPTLFPSVFLVKHLELETKLWQPFQTVEMWTWSLSILECQRFLWTPLNRPAPPPRNAMRTPTATLWSLLVSKNQVICFHRLNNLVHQLTIN